MVNVKYTSIQELMEWCGKLEGQSHEKIEWFMSSFYGMHWIFEEKAWEILAYLKETMYFDKTLGYWVDK